MPKTIQRTSKNGRVHGFKAKPVIRTVVFDPATAAKIGELTGQRARWEALVAGEGEEPLTAQIRDGLTFAQQDRIPFTGKATHRAIWAAIAPSVVGWNVIGVDAETGEERLLPPPAEAGPEIFASAQKEIALWLAWCLKYDQGDPDFPKGSPPTAASDGPAAGASSA